MSRNKSLVHGKGINDVDYSMSMYRNVKQADCPYYRKWRSVLTRCYSPAFQKRSPFYKGCTVTEKWLTFSNFKAWMMTQAWEGLQLDKDMLIPGNKIYGPDACMFIPQDINKLLNDSKATRGRYPHGVYSCKDREKFQAEISKYGKRVHLGRYSTVEQAELAYIKAKASHIRNVAEEQIDRLADALRRHAALLEAKLV